MTVWMLHLPLTAEDEAHIAERTHVPLPFDAPDLSVVSSYEQCKRMLRALYPGEPPETTTRRADKLWPLYSALQNEDLIVVPLPGRKEAVLAEITGRYEYDVGEGGSDIHRVPVRWYDKRVPFRALARYPELLKPTGSTLFEVTQREARTAIRNRLPHAYNRFVKLQWLLGVFFLLGAIRLLQMLGH